MIVQSANQPFYSQVRRCVLDSSSRIFTAKKLAEVLGIPQREAEVALKHLSQEGIVSAPYGQSYYKR